MTVEELPSQQEVSSPAVGFPARLDRRGTRSPTLSVILPTYNEADNIATAIGAASAALLDLDHEIIVVDDDSPDKTWQVAEQLAETNNRVRVVRRFEDRGLSAAVMAGMAVADGRVLVVMDADLQHDEKIIPDLLSAVIDDGADIAIGSRQATGGSYGEWSKGRRAVSGVGSFAARSITRVPITDPMSGFFAMSRQRYEQVAPAVNPRGFKILLEFVARGPEPRVAEVGYAFRTRTMGETKLSSSVAFSFLLAIMDLLVGRVVSAAFTAYALVGLSGVAVRAAAVITLGYLGVGTAFLIAFELSVLSNYFLNNRFTFAAHTRSGRAHLGGLALFHLVALHGFIVTAGLTSLFKSGDGVVWEGGPWYLQAIGLCLATAGNFVLNRSLTWRARPGLVARSSSAGSTLDTVER